MKAKKTTATKAAKPTKAQPATVDKSTVGMQPAAKAKAATKAADGQICPPKISNEKAARKAATPTSRRAAIEAAAAAGNLPAPPDFSAETHRRFRKKLADLIALAEAGDVAALRAFPINPCSTSPRALDRYRSLCVTALSARQAADG